MQSNSPVDIFISCRGLKNLDFLLDKSDPYVQVSFCNSSATNNKFTIMGRTQTKFNELNPNFDKSIRVAYYFQKKQLVRFDVYDKDGSSMANDDYIGSCTTTMAQMMGADKQTLILDIKDTDGKPAGKLISRCDAASEGSQLISMQWQGIKLMNTDSWFDFIDKSDPYLKFIKVRSDNTKVVVCTTQVINDNLNPKWKPVKFSLNMLTDGDPNKQFYVECWDHQDQKAHQFIGEVCINLKMLQEAVKNKSQLSLKNPKQKGPGFILCNSLKVQQRYTFVQYLRGGMKIQLQTFIDFTGSNQAPTLPSSLHYINPKAPNRYQMALHGVCQILLNYSADGLVPTYGFGAVIRNDPTRSVRHCFPLSFNPDMASAVGLQGIMNLYSNCLSRIQFSGPTYFTHVLKQAIQSCRAMQSINPFHYSIVLILTDGQIHDMAQTINLICQAATLGMSIVVVGIGSGNFDNMTKLDGDGDVLYNSKGERCLRDVVQFVKFEDMNNDKDRLRDQVLAQIPKQVQDYYLLVNMKPLQAMHAHSKLKVQQPNFQLNQIVGPMMNMGFQGVPMGPGMPYPGPPPGVSPQLAERLMKSPMSGQSQTIQYPSKFEQQPSKSTFKVKEDELLNIYKSTLPGK